MTSRLNTAGDKYDEALTAIIEMENEFSGKYMTAFEKKVYAELIARFEDAQAELNAAADEYFQEKRQDGGSITSDNKGK